MKIYDLNGNLLAADPDLALGWVEHQQRLVAHHEAVEEQSHLEIMPGTDGLRHKVVDAPARAAWDEWETVGVYHPYTPEELAHRAAPSLEQQVEANAAAIEERAVLLAGGEPVG